MARETASSGAWTTVSAAVGYEDESQGPCEVSPLIAEETLLLRDASRLLHACFGRYRPGDTVEKRTQRTLARLGTGSCPTVFVARGPEDEFLGTGSLLATDLPNEMRVGKEHMTPWLASVAVPEAHRRHGVACTIVEAVCEAARAHHHQSLWLWCPEKLQHFYVKLDFVVFSVVAFRGNMFTIMKRSLVARV